MFSHMLADYALQTNWIVARKNQSINGLLLHGFIVFLMSILVLPRYINVLFIPLLIMGAIHTVQDWAKVYSGPRLKIHPFYPYMADQLLHYLAIVIFQLIVGSWLNPAPSPLEYTLMAVGAIVMAATRFYDVTWWANWLDMIPYMNRWQTWGYAERLAMVALSSVGLFFIAPFCALPRFAYARYIGIPITRQERGLLEMGIGILFSIALGLFLRGIIAV